MNRLLTFVVCTLLANTALAVNIPGGGGNIPCDGQAPAANQICARNAGNTAWVLTTNTSGGAPTNAGYWTGAADATLSSEQNLGGLATALVLNTAGVPSAYAGATCAANRFTTAMTAVGGVTCSQIDIATDALTGVLPLARGGIGSAVTPTDDGVLVGNGSGFVTKVIQNCVGAGKLLYDATSNSFSCGIDQNNTGAGDVVGPSGSAINALAFFSDSGTGKALVDASALGLSPATLYMPMVDSSGGTLVTQVSGVGSPLLSITPAIVNPFIVGFDNANHDHSTLSQGGQLNINTAHNVSAYGPLTLTNGGTGVATCTGCGSGYSIVGSISPVLTGAPAVPTPPANDNDTSIATTAFVQTEVHETGGIGTNELSNLHAFAGACTNCNINYDLDGRITFAGNGTAGSGSGITQIGSCGTDPCFQTELQNKFFGSPDGSTGQATFRSLLDADLPATISGTRITTGIAGTAISSGIVAAARLGTGGTGTNFLRSDGTFATPPGTGTVTSVDLSVPAASIFASSGGPVTTTGTLALATNGTSGGIPYFSSATALSSSAALTASRIVLGGGAGGAPTVVGSLGTTSTLLHGNAGGAPSFGAVALATEVSGTLPVANGGTGATTLTNGGILLGTGTSAVHALAVATNGQIPIGDGTTDPVLATLTGTAAEVDITNGAGSITVGLPNDVTVANNLSVNNIVAVANQADGSNGLDMFNNSVAMQAGSSGRCNLAFVNSRISKRCNGVATTAGTPYANIFAEGTLALATGAINTATCATAQTVSTTGVLTTDVIVFSSSTTPAAPGALLTINAYATADNVNFIVCNPTAGSITPGARSINWKVLR